MKVSFEKPAYPAFHASVNGGKGYGFLLCRRWCLYKSMGYNANQLCCFFLMLRAIKVMGRKSS